MNGGLPRWVDEGLPIDTEAPVKVEPAEYPAPTSTPCKHIRSGSPHLHANQSDHTIPYPSGYENMVANSAFNPTDNVNVELVLDARSRGR